MSGHGAAAIPLCSLMLTVFVTVGIQPCAAQNLPNVTGSTYSPVEVPRTNLTPISPPTYTPPSYTPPTYAPPSLAPQTYAPPANIAPPTFVQPPTASLGAPVFDPYSTGANPGTFAPALPPGYGGTPTFGVGNPGYGPQGLQPPTFPPEAYPAGSPNSLFPGGLFAGDPMNSTTGVTATAFRLFQGPRFQYAWIPESSGPDSLAINEFETSLVFAFPDFLSSGQPIYVMPSFGLHLLAGPDGSTGADLPGQVYDAYLDTAWKTDPAKLVGADLGLRLGVFSDFETSNSDSFRIMCKALATFRLTPYSTLKGGVWYVDRNDIKILPAFGLLYQPTPNSRCDIFFPEPKFSKYCSTVGTQDVWGYIGGEYGGGAWTITRTSGEEDNIDINDYRVFLGAEWGRSEMIRNGRNSGFFELGYVFERDVVYKNNPQNDFSPGSAFMFRFGYDY